ncbi:indolepyruvate oxidoreductase subunit beta family protein [Variovorax sp. J22G21]|uniref:indolepyruvate oxidoreductase subunit beta family protein n=1 Tax=Variovorax fucosicus TaxID=3053517 RepID=UPI002576DB48|nr:MULTISPECIES: indolepyruvate oxidoreductase subunit beta family protein [unclassified Variovorax]MDM0037815.1 indolepyruvate oxidoreductase subunit beta family protein [Variovorax sp. J22R193]MDM0056516.1 indolepyruvate oxidoreductase subunit beta family protein [Variovorax sp. J22G47]MDM0062591.1 indolepyruvate oxidoreductase subunit beta family protein [Variovorax sp. J22G21]
MNRTQPISLLVCALGGEGGGVLTEWLVDIARHAGYAAQSTSIPGVAQRTGATTYYVEVFPVPLAQLGGRRPVFSLSPVPGTLDAIVSSELLETARQIGNGMSGPQRTLVITSSSRTLTTAERMQPGDGRADAQRLLDTVKSFSREHHVFDMGTMAREAGTVVSAVMLGAIAGSGLFPFPRKAYEAVVRGRDTAAPEQVDKMAAASLRGFARAFDAVSAPRAQAALVTSLLSNQEPSAPVPQPLPPDVAQAFPLPVHAMLALGHARLLDYQDAGYAALYVARLQQVLAAERAADPAGANGFAVTREMARWLALWMAFDDIVRVAELKSRASRTLRVHTEVKAGADDIVKVYDHFKPGAAEFAALLPRAPAQRVTAWDRARQARGRAPWALPLKVGSHSVFGMLSLRVLASLRWLRKRGSRFAEEQALIERWLAAVVAGTRTDWRLGHEIALCGRLIKGYGATLERGKANLLHVIDHLATAPLPDGAPTVRATAIAAARSAALADDAGIALDAVLQRAGAPARPVLAQPIRWMKRNPQPR